MAITLNSDMSSRIIVNDNQQIDLITNNQTRFRVEQTGQIKATYESTTGTDYNTTLHNGYLCRAWVNFNGYNATIRACGNVASVTYLTGGLYQVNFQTPMPDASYAVVVGMSSFGGGTNAHFSTPRETITASSFKILIMDIVFNQVDTSEVYAIVMR